MQQCSQFDSNQIQLCLAHAHSYSYLFIPERILVYTVRYNVHVVTVEDAQYIKICVRRATLLKPAFRGRTQGCSIPGVRSLQTL